MSTAERAKLEAERAKQEEKERKEQEKLQREHEKLLKQQRQELEKQRKQLEKNLQQAHKAATSRENELGKIAKKLEKVKADQEKVLDAKNRELEKLEDAWKKLQEEQTQVSSVLEEKKHEVAEAQSQLDEMEKHIQEFEEKGGLPHTEADKRKAGQPFAEQARVPSKGREAPATVLVSTNGPGRYVGTGSMSLGIASYGVTQAVSSQPLQSTSLRVDAFLPRAPSGTLGQPLVPYTSSMIRPAPLPVQGAALGPVTYHPAPYGPSSISPAIGQVIPAAAASTLGSTGSSPSSGVFVPPHHVNTGPGAIDTFTAPRTETPARPASVTPAAYPVSGSPIPGHYPVPAAGGLPPYAWGLQPARASLPGAVPPGYPGFQPQVIPYGTRPY